MSPTVDQPCALNESRVFSASLWYSKPGRFGGGSNHTVPTSPAGSSSPISSRMWIGPSIDRPTEPGCASQSAAVDVRRARAFRCGVVLVDDRAPPLDHLALRLDRARRRGVDRDLLRRHVVLRAHRRREASACARTSSAPTGCASRGTSRCTASASSGSNCSITMTVPPRRIVLMQ